MNKQLQSSKESMYQQQLLQPSSENADQQQPLTNDDEIDLRKLFFIFWQAKWIIFSSMLICGAIAIGYAANQQEWWTSKAVVMAPNLSQVAPFSLIVKGYQDAFDVKSNINIGNNKVGVEELTTIRDIDSLIDIESIFERFIQIYNSTENKRTFLNNSNDFNEINILLGLNNEINENVNRITENKWFSRINAIKNKKNSNYTLSIQSISDESSYLLLSSYIKFTNERVKNELKSDLQAIINIRQHELDQQFQSRLLLVEQNLKHEIIRAEYALKIAKAAKVIRPLENWNENEIFSIALGSDGIAAKIVILKSVTNLLAIDPTLEIMINKIELINKPLEIIENLKSFKLLNYPEMPLTRDNINIALVIFLSLMIGLFLGMLIVFLKSKISLRNE